MHLANRLAILGCKQNKVNYYLYILSVEFLKRTTERIFAEDDDLFLTEVFYQFED